MNEEINDILKNTTISNTIYNKNNLFMEDTDGIKTLYLVDNVEILNKFKTDSESVLSYNN